MLFYSYAEFVIGLVAIFYFTSKIFSITKYKLYFALSLIFIISTASFACFIKSDQRYVILPVLHFIALTFLPISLGYNKKMMLLFSSLFFWSEKHGYQPSLSFQLFDKFLTSLNIFINAFQTGCKLRTFYSNNQMFR